ncbi:hypothetical protein SDRG_14077 [Saprolegnia diclina VS20]|uniref:BART domain-containing protein n=1 Tax=Saprolegnia diclina (strain VS20) TaxID=1156394 RepID=T0PRX8_SAPDV|nr:hypothetical protein SDRG_14077 [Saprolegnia diclina VS20]EQC28254.1 hypothetical protein SDRG_14077 [Saprolegnia diclina VS20]|eukprot:XP_008618403.1 hypothetical protein SDRG_14077 [Saprolegnia diclina VS20]
MDDTQRVAVVERLCAFAATYNLETSFQAFAAQHAMTFSTFDEDDEQPLECFELFQTYECMHEAMIAAFLNDEQMDARELYDVLSSVQATMRDSDVFESLSMLLSALDFPYFGRRMRDEAIDQQRAAKDADDMGF